MTRRRLSLWLGAALAALALQPTASWGELPKLSEAAAGSGEVRVASLIYGNNKTSTCFSRRFLTDITQNSSVRAHPKLEQVEASSERLFQYPFVVMTGDGSFTLTDGQRDNLRKYLQRGGFVVSSASCSSFEWNRSMTAELKKLFPALEPKPLSAAHPVFHTVYDIRSSGYKHTETKLPILRGLELDGKVVLIHSPDGLNDTSSDDVDSSCCCCGGDEISEARKINVNLLAYALIY